MSCDDGFYDLYLAPIESRMRRFVSSACVATLVGLAAVGLPREDRALGQAPGAPSRLVWYGFPLLTVLMVVIAWLMVSTPMKMRP